MTRQQQITMLLLACCVLVGTWLIYLHGEELAKVGERLDLLQQGLGRAELEHSIAVEMLAERLAIVRHLTNTEV